MRDVPQLSIPQIGELIRKAQEQSPLQLPIARRMAKGSNTFITRMILRCYYQASHSFPHLYGRLGGGISVSSLIRSGYEGLEMIGPAYGPTALTISPGLVLEKENGKTELLIGIGYDHSALGGYAKVRSVDIFTRILYEADAELLGL